eukprot:SAG25_NODE_1374_length_3176_cov_1.855704_2_plen_208_part_00
MAAVATNSPCPPAQGLWLPRAVLMAARLTGGMLHEFEDQRAARTATMYSAAREEFQALLRAAVPRRSRAAYHLRVIIHRDPHSLWVGWLRLATTCCDTDTGIIDDAEQVLRDGIPRGRWCGRRRRRRRQAGGCEAAPGAHEHVRIRCLRSRAAGLPPGRQQDRCACCEQAEFWLSVGRGERCLKCAGHECSCRPNEDAVRTPTRQGR